jgi:putative hydroxymethylpyrimidine transport system substrate-binding protein
MPVYVGFSTGCLKALRRADRFMAFLLRPLHSGAKIMRKLALAFAAMGTLLMESGSGHASDKLTLMLDWIMSPDDATLLAAQYSGAFEEAGLDVVITAPADPNLPPRLVAAKQADLAITYEPQIHLMADQGLPLVRVGTLVDTPLRTVTVRADGPIKTVADLKGHKIGYPIAGVAEAIVGTMLHSVNLSLTDVTLVNTGFQQVQALMSKQVDGVVGVFRNFEVEELKLNGVTPLVFFPEEHSVPIYDELIFIAHKDSAKDPRLPRFLAALQKGTVFLLNHPDEVWAYYIKNYPDHDNELNKISWRVTAARFDKNPAFLDRARYDKFEDFMLANKLIKTKVPVEQYAIQVQ